MIFGRRKNDTQERNRLLDQSSYAAFFGLEQGNYSGVEVSETTALGISAVWRGTNLIASTLAQLKLDAYRYNSNDTRKKVRSWISNPGLPLYTRFEFIELLVGHLLLHGNAFLLKIKNQAGGVVGLYPVHPSRVSVLIDTDTYTRTFEVSSNQGDGGPKIFSEEDMLHIPAFSTDGVRGLSVIAVARNSLGVAIAGERAAAKVFNTGGLLAGIVTPVDEDISEEDAKIIKESLDAKTAGWEHAGEIAVVNRKLRFDPWTMTLQDAEFIKSREFQIDEIARWFGLPPYELMKVDKQTSYGTGVEKQQQGVARQVLAPWASRIEQRLSLLLPNGVEAKFNFKTLERPTPVEEINSLINQVGGGLLTPNEARTIQNMEPKEGGDQLQLPGLGTPAQPTGGAQNDITI